MPRTINPSAPLESGLRCGIALGSNIPDRMAHLREARAAVERLHAGSAALRVSPVYEAEPVECEPGTGPYLNAVIEIEWSGTPHLLLDALREIERRLGRPSERPRNAPRTIDLDVLYAGGLTLDGDELTIPHPRLHTRRFVLRPLADSRPELCLPGRDESVSALLTKLPERPSVTRVSLTWNDEFA